MTAGRIRTEAAKHAFLWLILGLTFLPLYLMLNISLKDNAQFYANPWWPQPPFHWENFAIGWRHVGGSILNTAFVAFMVTGLSLGLAIGGAFFFGRYRIPGGRPLFALFMVLMMYPSVANLVPTFKLICALGLYNSFWSVILLSVAGTQAFTIYILRNFIEEIPGDLFDSAQIDGCSLWQQLRYIVVPLSLPIVGTLGIMTIIGEWNSFVGPLVMLRDPQKQLLAVSLLHMEGECTKQWGQLMAGYTIASLPLVVLFLFCMRLFIKGLTEGAVKG